MIDTTAENIAITQSDNWHEIIEEFIKLYCIGCPYSDQERITESGPGCYLQMPRDVVRDLAQGECSTRSIRDYDWTSWRKK